MSDAEVKKINILYYARVSTDLKLTEPFDIEIHQIPPNLVILTYGRKSRWSVFWNPFLFHGRPKPNVILPLFWTLLSANGHWVGSRPEYCL